MDESREEPAVQAAKRRRRLRAVLAADIANFGGLVSVDETKTLDALWVARRVAKEELEKHGGWLFGLPGDGVFALFESAVDAVRCALNMQARLAAMPKLDALKMRIGVHLGEVLFQDDLPFGESLVIAARLESLAEPGGVLVSSAVMDAVSSRISATFAEMGVRSLKHSPRRIATFSVTASPGAGGLDITGAGEPLDHTVLASHPDRQAAAKAADAPVAAESQPAPDEQPAEAPTPRNSLTSVLRNLADVLHLTEPASPPDANAELQPARPEPTPEQRSADGLPASRRKRSVLDASLIAPLPKAAPFPPPLPVQADAPPASAPVAVEASAEQPPTAAAAPVASSLTASTSAPPEEQHHFAEPVTQAGLAEIARVLTTHVGPVAKLLVRRHAAEVASPSKLIRLLAQEIPAETERHDFVRHAHEALSGLSES